MRLLVSYDLRNDRDYEVVYEYLETYDHCRPLESVYLISTDRSASEVRDDLRELMDDDDGILVVNTTGKGSAWWEIGGCGSWIKAHRNG